MLGNGDTKSTPYLLDQSVIGNNAGGGGGREGRNQILAWGGAHFEDCLKVLLVGWREPEGGNCAHDAKWLGLVAHFGL